MRPSFGRDAHVSEEPDTEPHHRDRGQHREN